MASPTLLDVFLTLSRRPHHQCLHKLRSSPAQCIRYASSIPTQKPQPAPKPPGAPSSVSSIPLHVGLDRNPTQKSAISQIPIPKGVRGEEFVPPVLARPLGLPYPPQPGQHSPTDNRSWSARTDEFADPTKVQERRKVYLRSYLRPYFQEWKRMDFNKGKSFQSNERMFRRDKALYFPNIVGETLSTDPDKQGPQNTVSVMNKRISIVGMMSGDWAQEQVDSFVSPKNNPDLQKLMDGGHGRVQRVDVNMQPDWFKLMLVRLFKGRLRKLVEEERWDRYFMIKLPRDIRRGFTEETRDAMGLLNSQVGYVYLVDTECRIRWAGSGHAWPGEVNGLNKAVERLLNERSQLMAGGPLQTGRYANNLWRPSEEVGRPIATPA